MPEAVSDGTLVKRREVAKMLGWSESKVRRKEGTLLNPIVAPDGVHRFRAEEVETIRRVRVDAQQTPSDFDGPTASRVFALLDEGLHPVEIVKRTSLDPRAVTAIYDEWVSMLGGFAVYERHLIELELLPWLQGAFPMRSADELVVAVRDSTPGECVQCRMNTADFCGPCVSHFTEADEAKRVAAQRGAVAEASLRRGTERNHLRRNKDARRAAHGAGQPVSVTSRRKEAERNAAAPRPEGGTDGGG